MSLLTEQFLEFSIVSSCSQTPHSRSCRFHPEQLFFFFSYTSLKKSNLRLLRCKQNLEELNLPVSLHMCATYYDCQYNRRKTKERPMTLSASLMNSWISSEESVAPIRLVTWSQRCAVSQRCVYLLTDAYKEK